MEQIFLPVTKVRHRLIPRLHLRLAEINARPHQPRRRPRLQSPQRQPHLLQRPAQAHRRALSGATARLLIRPHVHQAPQERPRRDHHRLAHEAHPQRRLHPLHHSALHDQRRRLTLLAVQPRLPLAHPLHPKLIRLLIALRARCPHARAALCVQHAELQPRHIRRLAHLAAERINFPRQMPLRQAADGRVARHLPDGVQVDGQQQRLRAHARRRQRRLHPRVPRADDDDIVLFWINEHGSDKS